VSHDFFLSRTWGLNNVRQDFNQAILTEFSNSYNIYNILELHVFEFCPSLATHIQDPPELSGGKLAHVECSFYHFLGVLKLVAIAQNFRTPQKW